MRIREERCSVNGESKVESEVNSPSNGEETDEMPALTDSDGKRKFDLSLLLQIVKHQNQKMK